MAISCLHVKTYDHKFISLYLQLCFHSVQRSSLRFGYQNGILEPWKVLLIETSLVDGAECPILGLV